MKLLKPFFSIVLMFAFLGSTLGVQVYKHYCGDFLEEVSLYIQSNPCADEGGEDACSKGKEMSCCDDEEEFYQLKIDLIKHSHSNQDFKFLPISTVKLFDEVVFTDQKLEGSILVSKPPLLNKLPIYKRLQRFTYYG